MSIRPGPACALLALLLAAACDRPAPTPTDGGTAEGTAPGTGPVPAAPSIEIPDPSTAGMEPRVVARIAEGRARVVAAPLDAAAWGFFGSVCFPHDFFDEAAVAFAEANRLEPSEFKWAYMLAVTLDIRGQDPDRAREIFEEAMRLKPDYLPGLVRRGEAMSRAGSFDDAIASLNAALELKANDPSALRRLGEALLQTGRIEEAVPILERATKADAQASGTWRSLAQAYQRTDRADDAIRALDRSRELPNESVPLADPVLDEVMAHGISSSICLDRGEQFLRAGRVGEAYTLFKVCEEVHPTSAMVQTYLGLCLIAADEVDEAERHFRSALELAPEQYDALTGLASVQGRRSDLAGAESLLDRAIAVDDARPQAHARRGLVLAMQGRLKDALESFAAAEARGPLTAADHYNWAKALIDGNLPAEAGARLQLALRVDPRHVPSHMQLGSLYEALGVYDRARWHYQMVLRLQPKNAKAAERLSELPQ